jgi:hypothetical protein
MAEWTPERIQLELERVGVGYAEIAERTDTYPHHVKGVVRGRVRNRTVEECIAGLVGASRLEVFGLNKRELSRAHMPTDVTRLGVCEALKRMRISRSLAAEMTGFSRVSVCVVLSGRRYYPRVWSALQALVGAT